MLARVIPRLLDGKNQTLTREVGWSHELFPDTRALLFNV